MVFLLPRRLATDRSIGVVSLNHGQLMSSTLKARKRNGEEQSRYRFARIPKVGRQWLGPRQLSDSPIPALCSKWTLR